MIDPLLYAEREARVERQEAYRAEYARVCPPPELPVEPHVEDSACLRLRKLLAEIIQQRDYWHWRSKGQGNWRYVLNDSEELKSFCGQASAALGPVIGLVTAAADEHEQRSLQF